MWTNADFCWYCTFCSTTAPLGVWPAEAERVTLSKSWAWIPPWVCKPILQEEHRTAELLWRSSIRPAGVPVWVWRWKILYMKKEIVHFKTRLWWHAYYIAMLFERVVVSGILIIWLFVCLFVQTGLNVEDLKQRTYKFFGAGSEYDTPVNDPYRDKGGRFNPLHLEIIVFVYFFISSSWNI